MLLCRSAWQRLVPLTQRATTATLLRNAPVRQMSAGSVPGSSGEALPYYLFVAVSLAGGVAYAYHTVSRDRARSHDRHEYIETQLKPKLGSIGDDSVTVETGEVSEITVEAVEAVIEEAILEEVTEATTSMVQEQPVTEEEASLSTSEEELAVNAEVSPEQGVTVETGKVSETTVEVVEAVLEEAIAEEVTEQEAGPTATMVQEQPTFEEEASLSPSEEEPAVNAEASIEQGATVETEEVSEITVEAVEGVIEEAVAEEVTEQEAVPTTSLEKEQPVAEEEATLSPSEEEPAVSAVASTEQAEQKNAEPVAEAVAVETSPVLEASSDNIPEELSSAAEDWSELSARKPEESVEISDAAQESEEAIESEVAASS
ncbi:protein MGARP isoform X3 [Rana temporaria]|uniref:protein MGARP isoform X3 n=1 Tax=Rana temporaria TaxID=8407 RepID=UPI001AAD95BB|nr:protein MGARP isoform X3 [Rana temporaria]